MGVQIGWATADICDTHEPLLADGRLRILGIALENYGGSAACRGPVSTIRCFEDTSRVHEAVREHGAGGVLVIDGAGSRNRVVVGGSIALLAAENGWAGIIANGCVRDAADLREVGIPVYALGAVPRRSNRVGSGERNVQVEIGGCAIAPGFWLYADDDGILISRDELLPVDRQLCELI